MFEINNAKSLLNVSFSHRFYPCLSIILSFNLSLILLDKNICFLYRINKLQFSQSDIFPWHSLAKAGCKSWCWVTSRWARGIGKIYRMIDHCHWFLFGEAKNHTVHMKYLVSKGWVDKANLSMTFSELKLRSLRQTSILSLCGLNKISLWTFDFLIHFCPPYFIQTLLFLGYLHAPQPPSHWLYPLILTIFFSQGHLL